MLEDPRINDCEVQSERQKNESLKLNVDLELCKSKISHLRTCVRKDCRLRNKGVMKSVTKPILYFSKQCTTKLA